MPAAACQWRRVSWAARGWSPSVSFSVRAAASALGGHGLAIKLGMRFSLPAVHYDLNRLPGPVAGAAAALAAAGALVASLSRKVASSVRWRQTAFDHAHVL